MLNWPLNLMNLATKLILKLRQLTQMTCPFPAVVQPYLTPITVFYFSLW